MENLPKLVVRQWEKDSAQGGRGEAHPDANLLAAFAEQCLPQRERTSLMKHLALCGNCREVVALALPDDETALAPALAVGAGAGWLRWPALRWGLVAAGIVVVTVSGVEYSRVHWHPAIGRDPVHNEAAARKTEQPQAAAPTPVPPPTDVAADESPQAHPVHAARATPLDRQEGSPNRGANANEDGIAMNRAPAIGAESRGGIDIVKAKDAVPSPTESGNPIGIPVQPLQTSPRLLLRASPRWLVTPEGTLQRTFDGGKKWETVDPSADPSSPIGAGQQAPSGFRAVSASGLEVWVGGVSGVLYHTSDGGSHWTRVIPSVAGVALSAEIVKIEFSGAQRGSVSTFNAEYWTTSDGGQTWQKQP